MMNNFEITQILEKDYMTGPLFGGVYACNQLPLEVTYPGCYVMNTDPSYKPGEHWVAAYFCDDGQVEYFDSYGKSPTGPIKHWLKRQAWDVHWSTYLLQGPWTAVCGQYCTFYLLKRCRGWDFADIAGMLDDDDHKDSDQFVYEYINDYL